MKIYSGLPKAILLLLVACFITHSTPCRGEYFTIDRFQADISIRNDASLFVKETIAVTFDKQRHGIYREIPLHYSDRTGRLIRTPIHVLSVENSSGGKWDYRLTHKSGLMNIRIGHSKRYVTGRQTYVIFYEVVNAVTPFDNRDELYWNVTGNGWDVPIEKVQANVFFPAAGMGKKLQMSCFTGHQGSRESACSWEEYDNSLSSSSTRMFLPREGLTLLVAWEKGHVTPPSPWKILLSSANLRENWIFILPLLSLMFMISEWYTRGRDPRPKEAVTVMYEPPIHNGNPLSPAELGSLQDETLDTKDITAALIGLAVKGYLQIEQKGEKGIIFDDLDYDIIKLKEPGLEAGLFEKELFNALLPPGVSRIKISELKDKFYTHLPVLRKTLYQELVSKGFFRVSPERVRSIYAGVGFAVMLITGLSLGLLMPGQIGKAVIVGILSALPILLFSRAMPVKTKAGAYTCMQILGFREFLQRAEKDRIERMGEKNLFYRYLPYAMALDVVDNWCDAFAGLYQDPPNWYDSAHHVSYRNTSDFTRDFSHFSSSISGAMTSSPGGSGGNGGGGSSGGGGGGGGGGSW